MGLFKDKSLVKFLSILSLTIFCLSFFPLSTYAKIIPKDPKNSRLIYIKKGDTLWDLAGKYYKNPFKWRRFKKFNYISNPHLIYPGEKLAIDYKTGKCLIKDFKKELKALKEEKKKKEAEIASLKKKIEALKEENEKQKMQLTAKDEEIAKLNAKINELKVQMEELESEVAELEEAEKMLKAAIKELEAKLAEYEKTIAAQKQEIKKLTEEKTGALNFGHFMTFLLISSIIAIKAIK
jgi:peptidoglycan hydrolase CwlO-like protein